MKVLSFDCGLTNLSYCYFDKETRLIKEWEVFPVGQKNFDDIPKAIIRCLDERSENWTDVDVVMIERQPQRNRKMVLIQFLLQTYFLIRSMDKGRDTRVLVVSSLHKLGQNSGRFSGKSQYSQRKKTSVEMTNVFLQQHPQEEHIHQCFKESKKKDDLADCLNQALYCSTEPCAPPPAKTKIFTKDNVKARKPTPTQERKGYSPSNVAHFIKASDDFASEVSKNRKLASAVKKYFGTVQECIKAFE